MNSKISHLNLQFHANKTIFLSISTMLLLAFFMLSSTSTILGSNNETTAIIQPDSSSIPISQHDFDDKMDYYIDLMREEADFTEEEYVEMVLIDNTYFLFIKDANPTYRVQAHNQFLDFLQNYMDDILKTLEATEQGCNGGFYSAKHDLCVGGTNPNSKSVYDVVSN